MVLLFAAGTSAASIEVQESIPANTVWSFSVTLPNGTDFDDARVLLDGDRIISFETVETRKLHEEHAKSLAGVVRPKLEWKTCLITKI